MAKCWSQVEPATALPRFPPQNFMIRLPTAGQLQVALQPRAMLTPPLYCLMARVLVAGGISNDASALSSAELYDPATNSWSAAGSLDTARYTHTATLLPNGKVLVAGGWDSGIKGSTLAKALASAELYDPATNSWSSADNLATARYVHSATLLSNGKVLVAGGWGGNALADAIPNAPIPTNALASAELYDPVANTWSKAGNLASARYNHTATLLPSGKVLLVGGRGDCPTCTELYDPNSNSWSKAKDLPGARYNHTATLLPNGKVLVAGGTDGPALASAELYDPSTDSWSAASNINVARGLHTATRLLNGAVLVVGGWGKSALTAVASSELFR